MTIISAIATTAAVLYVVAVAMLAVYGLHSYYLLAKLLRHRKAAAQAERDELARPLPDELPHVLVQLPTFNERDVVRRLLGAIGRLDWPREKLHIQLLDDSTDDGVEIGREACAELHARGLDAVLIHRTDRTGYKAGALQNGMAQNDAPFIAIFDADFVPEPDFLKRAIRPLLVDPGLALVQGRWGHLNRHASMLTAAQALGMDGHFAIEQGARAWSGMAMNFNGTCGLWRRQAIHDGGGWEHDTLTEDMDLSYRVQLKGWRCTYRLGLEVPGEIPDTVSAWRAQQFRWAKGSIQTAIKLMPRIWTSSWGWHTKLCASLHMTHYLVHPLILVSLFCAPLALMLLDAVPMWALMLGFGGFIVGATSPIATYITSQLVLFGNKGWRNLRYLPPLAAIGTGIAVSNALAVWQALRGQQSPFVRTPKAGAVGAAKTQSSYRAKGASGMAELFCALWAAVGLSVSFTGEHRWVTPLLALYFSGFLWMGVHLIRERLQADQPDTAGPRAWSWLVPSGIALMAGCLLISLLPTLVPGATTWQEAPLLFGGAGLVLGAIYLVAVRAIKLRPQAGVGTICWILGVALVMRLLCLGPVQPTDPLLPRLGVAPATELNRAVMEGRQVVAGQNPYLVPPASLHGHGLVGTPVPYATFFAIEDAERTSTSGPLALAYQALVTAFSPSARAFAIGGLVCEMLALGLVLAMLLRLRLPLGLLLLAAWNPVGPLFLSGQGHIEAGMLLFFACGMYALTGTHQGRSVTWTTLAALVKPVAAVALLPQLIGRPWRAWLWPAALVTIAFLPFIEAGRNLAATVSGFGGAAHHGAIEPWLRLLVDGLTGAPASPMLIGGLLGAVWLAGSTALLLRLGRTAAVTDQLATIARLVALLLVCLPVLPPQGFAALVVLLPFARSGALVLWTALAPLWWVQGLSGQVGGELPLVTALAHLPAMALFVYECWAPRQLPATVQPA